MSTDYIVASLPALVFGAPAPIDWERFTAAGGAIDDASAKVWSDLETQLRNAMAEVRGGERYRRATDGCSLYWKNRVLDCFKEKDVMKREELLNRVWWDAAGELTPPSNPLGKGALATYAVRLKIALKRSAISTDAGNAAFDRLTARSNIAARSNISASPNVAPQ